MFSWLQKFRISNRLDEDGAPPRASERSDALKRYSDSMARVDAALRSDVDAQGRSPSRDLRRRTLEALQATTYEEAPARGLWKWPRFVGAVAMVAVAVAISIPMLLKSPNQTTGGDEAGKLGQIAKKTLDLRMPNLEVQAPVNEMLLGEAKSLLTDVRQARDLMVGRVPLRTSDGTWAFSPSSRRQ